MHNDIHKRRDLAHDFIVKFSPRMCVAVVASLTGEIAARNLLTMLVEQQWQILLLSMICMTWQNIIKSAMHAPSGSPPDDKSSY